jgi:hypothetical protein
MLNPAMPIKRNAHVLLTLLALLALTACAGCKEEKDPSILEVRYEIKFVDRYTKESAPYLPVGMGDLRDPLFAQFYYDFVTDEKGILKGKIKLNKYETFGIGLFAPHINTDTEEGHIRYRETKSEGTYNHEYFQTFYLHLPMLISYNFNVIGSIEMEPNGQVWFGPDWLEYPYSLMVRCPTWPGDSLRVPGTLQGSYAKRVYRLPPNKWADLEIYLFNEISIHSESDTRPWAERMQLIQRTRWFVRKDSLLGELTADHPQFFVPVNKPLTHKDQ